MAVSVSCEHRAEANKDVCHKSLEYMREKFARIAYMCPFKLMPQIHVDG